MAMCDYILCARCGEKAAYDGSHQVRDAEDAGAEIKALCPECAKTHWLVIEVMSEGDRRDEW